LRDGATLVSRAASSVRVRAREREGTLLLAARSKQLNEKVPLKANTLNPPTLYFVYSTCERDVYTHQPPHNVPSPWADEEVAQGDR
jgi:hypothetical protein